MKVLKATSATSPSAPGALGGVACGASAYLVWGLSPLYWKMFHGIPALEVISHRIVWSFLFLVPIVVLQSRTSQLIGTLRNVRHMSILALSALLVAFNWLLYIWAVNHAQVLHASLGYYINPLVNVLLGMLFLKERLRPAQVAAFALAAAGVFYLTWHLGRFPWISLSLAFSFGFYGLIRKVISIGSLVGLAIETLLLSIPAAIWLVVLNATHSGAFLHRGLRIDLLFVASALFTALPLLLFTQGARRLNLSTMGFLQYITPTGMFLLGVFAFNEPFSQEQIIAFILIWTALGLYSVDSVWTHHRPAPR
jgi:chloramphenicol-sensitive protein RarD